MNLKELLAAKKIAKHIKQSTRAQKNANLKALQQARKKINSKELEHGAFNACLTHIQQSLESNTVELNMFADYFIQLHRFTFLKDCEYLEARKVIEKLYTKHMMGYDLYTSDEIWEKVRLNLVKINHIQREILISFIEAVRAKFLEHTDRKLFSKENMDMLITHRIYCQVKFDNKINVAKFVNQKEIDDLLHETRIALSRSEVIKANKDGKIMVYDEINCEVVPLVLTKENKLEIV